MATSRVPYSAPVVLLQAPLAKTFDRVDTHSDATLVTRCLDGDRWAQELIYRRHAPRLLRTATHLLGNASDAEDVIHDAFILAFDRLGTLKNADALGGWLSQITVRQVYRRFRRRKMKRALGFVTLPEDTSLAELAGQDCNAEEKAELGLLSKKLRELAPGERVAWTLRYVEGHALAEVAQSCDCSLATAKRRIQKAHNHICRAVSIGSLENHRTSTSEGSISEGSESIRSGMGGSDV